MIRHCARSALSKQISNKNVLLINAFNNNFSQIKESFLMRHSSKISMKTSSVSLTFKNTYNFAFPKHNVLSMPALSPTMTDGKILKWYVKQGDLVNQGDVICQVETDKASVGFQVTEKGYIAKISTEEGQVSVGVPIAVLTKKKENVPQFKSFTFSGSGSATQTETPKVAVQQSQKPKQAQKKSQPASSNANLPKHGTLKFPAVSPTMTEGKILEWKINIGDQFNVGDSLFSIQTDKATVDYEATEKGYLAKIIGKSNTTLPVGQLVAVFAKKKADVDKLKDYTPGSSTSSSSSSSGTAQQKSQPTKVSQESTRNVQNTSSNGERIIASPLAKVTAAQKGIDISQVKGSGPDGRIIKQDVQAYKAPSAVEKQQVKSSSASSTTTTTEKPKAQKPRKVEILQNPYEQIQLNGMRKTIAARLTESKTTIPHYYVQCSVEMGKVLQIRTKLNANEDGIKISVNDMIVKATALALRDIPQVNAQWGGNVIKKFKHSDVSVAVATDGGLITPIVFRAQTLGLAQISAKTKDIAKRAREGKLDPSEYIGGTTTVSNLGMFGINSVTSVINPPQSTILGVGKTQKKIVFDPESTDPSKPYKVIDSMELIVSADHRVVDGALASRWLTRIKKYLEDPIHMML